eukprot:TRINITY_DN3750_c0_g2_i1.p1 TRINITY_DN3750_c0_g2~~TRINITY_DN3750_c0_g2_i1.p1  ORF type:complete len:110 (+),score=6.51 TRINITY_DN3750_c0_g2_i1:377-706(+)
MNRPDQQFGAPGLPDFDSWGPDQIPENSIPMQPRRASFDYGRIHQQSNQGKSFLIRMLRETPKYYYSFSFLNQFNESNFLTYNCLNEHDRSSVGCEFLCSDIFEFSLIK